MNEQHTSARLTSGRVARIVVADGGWALCTHRFARLGSCLHSARAWFGVRDGMLGVWSSVVLYGLLFLVVGWGVLRVASADYAELGPMWADGSCRPVQANR
jgi:hypothetical protein